MYITANGYILGASWLNCMFYALELFLTIRYLHRSSHSLLHKTGVVSMVAFDTICTAAIFVRVYNVFLGFPPNAVQPHLNNPIINSIGVILLSNIGTASLEQLFLCVLYFNLTKRRFITAFLLLSIVVHLGFSYAAAILVLHLRTNTATGTTASNIGAITCSVTDIMIATALLFEFIRIEMEVGSEKKHHSIIRRLIVLIFASGVVVAFVTLFTMVLMLKENPAYTVFFFIQGRMYALTIVGSGYAVRKPPESTLTFTGVSLPATIVSGNFRIESQGDHHTSPQER
ncbi:hypothetical protein B0H16DRAFT_1567874 [Mycena metata]|uniref:DUF6534 domain-containing protein n=1 Tax=Mycena metata TaxID=1033252 RepID=A0AAD7H2B5_9AGAR|nr:hypothetical protein B0H16DRAFT_1629907 [Mycena metata]KAJ7739804.1 hypothetical protein B0H16DRAFT_1567874 [Mycena metata]